MNQLFNWLYSFDVAAFRWINGFVGASETFDKLFSEFFDLRSARTMPIVALIFAAWFLRENRSETRTRIAHGLVGAVFAMAIARIVQNFSPHRPRPLHTPGLEWEMPIGTGSNVLHDWSSFPSDTSTLAFALATIVFLVHRRFGAAAYFWAFFITALPRVYAARHFPSDIVAGAILGTGVTALAAQHRLFDARGRRILEPVRSRPEVFYFILFVLMFQFADYFEDARRVAGMAKSLLN